jgi:hypothetical protein
MIHRMILLSGFIIVTAAFSQNYGARYLIITHDSYADVLKPLAEWKTQKGYKAKIVTLSEIGGSDSVSIRNYVVNAYNTWQIKPEYLLLVGNPDQIPFPQYYATWYGYAYTDNYYADVIGDFHNEILPGRMWVFDTINVKTIIAKILNYDKTPYVGDPLWYKKGSTVISEDGTTHGDSVYWSDARYTHQLMNNANYVQIDSFAGSLGDSSRDVINAVNDGRSYILFRGVGVQAWGPPFSDIDPALFLNGLKMPIVISATCETVDGIGWLWLNLGTPDNPRGMVGFLGGTTILDSASELRSALALGTLQEIFCDSFATLGKAAESGRLKYYQLFGNTLEYKSWTCLGDPEMTVRTAAPRIIEAVHSPEVWYGDTLTVQVKCDSVPVERALVCVRAWCDSTIYHYGRTDDQGYIKFIDSLQFSDTVFLTVTGRNLNPFVDTVIGGYSGGPLVKYISHTVHDSLNGNGNHQPNNGEDIELTVRIMNFGDSTARGVIGILQKYEPDNYYQLTDTIKTFPDIPSFDSVSTPADGYNIIISPICPDSHLIKLQLTIRDTVNNQWVSSFNIRVYCRRPYLVYQKNLILDSLGGNNDHQVNPAENIELPVWLKNIGDSLADNVIGTLQKAELDPYFALSDTIKNYGMILPQDSAATGTDGFNVIVDSQCPDQHPIKLRVKVKDALDSTWTYDFNLINHTAHLVYYDYYIDDTVKFTLRGDTSRLAVFLKNIGSGIADNIMGSLISPDSFLTVIDGSAQFGSLLPDSIGNNNSDQFVIYARPGTPAGYQTDLRLVLSAGPRRDTVNFTVYVGKRDYLVWDPDPNHSSGFIIHQKLNQLHFLGDYRQISPLKYINIYKTLFLTLGINPNAWILYDSCAIVPEIVHFMDAGGKFYLEGGNVWCHDTAFGGHNFGPLFRIRPVNDNSGYCSGVAGFPGSFTDGMSFRYTGETSSLDRIDTLSGGVLIFKNRTNNYVYGVAAGHRTIGVSFEFSGLVDSVPPSTKSILADSIMQYFGITPSGGISEAELQTVLTGRLGFEIYPNPARNQVRFSVEHRDKSIELKIYDVSGRLIKSFSFPYAFSPMPFALCWDGTDQSGRTVAGGIYFICLKSGGSIINKKVILLKD